MIYSVCRRRSRHEKVVQSGLALTPSVMSEMLASGMSFTSSSLPLAPSDGLPSTVVPRESVRGVSLNDLWNDRLNANKKFKKMEFND